ncbi:MAG TPA: hypothetical protein DEP23_09720 [Ruminococcaceae bacterium]|nr:hypothetical protein [Oscillospiraceae bacterium]
MKKDYSEYSLDEIEKYRLRRQGNQHVRFDYFSNSVYFNSESKSISITVDSFNEFIIIKEDLDEFDKIEAQHRTVHEDVLSPEEEAEREEFRINDLEKNKENFEKLCLKYDIDRSSFNERAEEFYDDYPDQKKAPLNNVLSGARISLSYGEGILDFVYSDFKTAFKEAIAFPLTIQELGKKLKEEQPEKYMGQHESEPDKIYNRTYELVTEYLRYTSTVVHTEEIIYKSLYTAICPPVFSYDRDTVDGLKWYYNYLITLQKEYSALIEFCFDKEFFPDVLGHMHPSERYNLYRDLHDQPAFSRRNETMFYSTRMMSGDKMPYGLRKDELLPRLTKAVKLTEQHREFAEHYKVEIKKLEAKLTFLRFLHVSYDFGSVAEILELELTKMLEQNVHFRKCKRCKKYFIMKGNYDTNYCDRIAQGETRNCQDIAAQENYKRKIADNAAIPIYSKYYKRYAARVRVNQIKESDFKQWKYKAMTKRDECSDGKITTDEYIQWMEECFPNRTVAK